MEIITTKKVKVPPISSSSSLATCITIMCTIMVRSDDGNESSHIGPTEGKGGMSVMMRNIQSITPSGYTSNSVNTHSDLGLFSKIKVMIKARFDISRLLKLKDFDICHVHLTHGFSWFRKYGSYVS